MKKIMAICLSLSMASFSITGCTSPSTTDSTDTTTPTGVITVISREDGSGTRGAFVELLGIEEKDSTGTKIDRTIDTADITNSTSVMMTGVSGNKTAIGYISLGSLNDSVKALNVDGVEPTAQNILSGDYKIARPFNIVTKGELSPLTSDFISFILSTDGQQVVSDNGYIALSDTTPYEGTKVEGKITVGGSSSVSPVMEKLTEAYKKINLNATIELSQSDSTTGVNSVVDGIYDIGMASRAIKDSESEKGVTSQVIATDGIAIIVSPTNQTVSLTAEQIKEIYIGEITTWDELK